MCDVFFCAIHATAGQVTIAGDLPGCKDRSTNAQAAPLVNRRRSAVVEPCVAQRSDHSGVTDLHPLALVKGIFNAARQQESSSAKAGRRQYLVITQAPNHSWGHAQSASSL